MNYEKSRVRISLDLIRPMIFVLLVGLMISDSHGMTQISLASLARKFSPYSAHHPTTMQIIDSKHPS